MTVSCTEGSHVDAQIRRALSPRRGGFNRVATHPPSEGVTGDLGPEAALSRGHTPACLSRVSSLRSRSRTRLPTAEGTGGNRKGGAFRPRRAAHSLRPTRGLDSAWTPPAALRGQGPLGQDSTRGFGGTLPLSPCLPLPSVSVSSLPAFPGEPPEP